MSKFDETGSRSDPLKPVKNLENACLFVFNFLLSSALIAIPLNMISPFDDKSWQNTVVLALGAFPAAFWISYRAIRQRSRG